MSPAAVVFLLASVQLLPSGFQKSLHQVPAVSVYDRFVVVLQIVALIFYILLRLLGQKVLRRPFLQELVANIDLVLEDVNDTGNRKRCSENKCNADFKRP